MNSQVDSLRLRIAQMHKERAGAKVLANKLLREQAIERKRQQLQTVDKRIDEVRTLMMTPPVVEHQRPKAAVEPFHVRSIIGLDVHPPPFSSSHHPAPHRPNSTLSHPSNRRVHRRSAITPYCPSSVQHYRRTPAPRHYDNLRKLVARIRRIGCSRVCRPHRPRWRRQWP
jgi:hypothetical protein